MKPQMMRVISSPSSSTTGVFTLILAIVQELRAGAAWGWAVCAPRGREGQGTAGGGQTCPAKFAGAGKDCLPGAPG
jgi:hypothetical protein